MNIPLYPYREEIEKRVLAAPTSQGTENRRRLCVTVYLPRQTAVISPAHRKFRLIKLLKRAERLIAIEHGEVAARRHMASLWQTEPMKLIDQSGQALAIFHEDDFTGALPIPIDVPEKVVVSTSYHIKPVLFWLQSAPHFYLISLSSRRVKLYEGSPWELRLLDVIHSPWEDELQPSRLKEKAHRIHPKERLRQFFLQAESVVGPVLRRDRHPVVLAGVSQLHSIYRRVNRDPDLTVHAIHGNVERWDEADLRQAAQKILEKLTDRAKDAAIEEFEKAMVYGHATDDLAHVARAAVKGKVRKIMVASDSTIWGTINPNSGELTIHPEQLGAMDDDLLDDLAEIVLAKGGKVLCLPSAELPTASPVAALMSG